MKHITNNEALEIFKKYDPELYNYYINNACFMSYNARNYAEYLKEQNENEQKYNYNTKEMREAHKTAGHRERYAMENGKRLFTNINGHKCIKFTYSENDPYQDANGATFDTVRGVWIA